MRTVTILALTLIAATPAQAQDWKRQVTAKLAESKATRFGLMVTDDTGREIIAIDPDGRYIPASNTKMVTTAVAFSALPNVNGEDREAGTQLWMDGRTLILKGHGDARMSSSASCVINCLATLADAVAAKTRRVEDIIGDATLFPDQRWSPGMSWNNITSRSGTAASALSVDDNEAVLIVKPGAEGMPPVVESYGYYTIENQVVTRAGARTSIRFDRDPGSRLVRLSGTIAADATPSRLRLGIDDPAHYTAWRFHQMLKERGVQVRGEARALYWRSGQQMRPVANASTFVAQLTPPPLADDLTLINKDSQNLHAELLIRRVGLRGGNGAIDDGVKLIEQMLNAAGIERTGWDFSDGSGMSTYNRISPRAMVKLLNWASSQPWGGQWRATMPIGGVDGTLRTRFKATPLEGKLFAKTGTINATNALSGYMISGSGRWLTFALLANDVPGDGSATRTMDAALAIIAAAN